MAEHVPTVGATITAPYNANALNSFELVILIVAQKVEEKSST